MELTEEQQNIINHPITSKALVTAGAGTGKTETLVHRVSKLLDHDEAVGSEILLLTFTRAASGELRRRVSSLTGRASFIRARTLDSFATRILSEVDSEGAWRGESYDGRIRYFTDLLDGKVGNPSFKEYGNGIKHLFIDEIQDLVGPRSEMVKSIVSNWDCGFTMFGDPAQGIYNFQLEGEAREIGSKELYEWLRNTFRDSLTEFSLTENYRALSPKARIALWAGVKLNHSIVDYGGVYRELAQQLEDCPELGMTNLQSVKGSLAILSHTNCEVEMISDELSELKIPHKVKPRSGENGISAWVGAALRTLNQGPVARNIITSRLSALEDTGTLSVPDPEEGWMTLRRLSGSNQVEIRRIHQRIHDFNVTDNLIDDDYEGLTISTVHRAKGLEFDYVLFVPPVPVDDDHSLDIAETARILYVGMTRHREEIFRTKPNALEYRAWSTRGGIANGRWLKWANRGRLNQQLWRETLTGFEIRGNDVDADLPAPADQQIGLSGPEVQSFLLNELNIGDALELELDTSESGSDQHTAYRIKHCKTGTIVGRTSRYFSRDLRIPLSRFASIVRRDINWPERLTGIRVHSIDTVAGPADRALPGGWEGTSRIWNRVRMHGLANIKRSGN